MGARENFLLYLFHATYYVSINRQGLGTSHWARVDLGSEGLVSDTDMAFKVVGVLVLDMVLFRLIPMSYPRVST